MTRALDLWGDTPVRIGLSGNDDLSGSTDGRWLCAASLTHTILDLHAPMTRHALPCALQRPVLSGEGDGLRLLGVDGAHVRTFTWPEGRALSSFAHAMRYVTVLAPSPDGRTVVVAGFDGVTQIVSHDGVCRATVTTEAKQRVGSVRFWPDGASVLLIADAAGVARHALDDGRLLRRYGPATLDANDAALSADGTTLFVACCDGNLRTYDVDSGEARDTRRLSKQSLSSVQLDPRGRWLIVACEDGTLRRLDATTLDAAGSIALRGCTAGVVFDRSDASCFVRDGTVIARVGIDPFVREALHVGHTTGVDRVVRQRDGRVVSFGTGEMFRWSPGVSSPEVLPAEHRFDEVDDAATRARLRVAARQAFDAEAWRDAEGPPETPWRATDERIATRFTHQDGRSFVLKIRTSEVVVAHTSRAYVRDQTRAIHAVDLDTQRIVWTQKVTGAAGLSVQGDVVLVWSARGVTLLDPRDGAARTTSNTKLGTLFGASLSQDGRAWVARGEKGVVVVRIAKGEEIVRIAADHRGARCVDLDTPEGTLVIGRGDGAVRAWSLR